uniref:Regulator of G protein signaling 17 n=1 Tax=Corvus moneduloides TaxID=1196302 RepID=A0A8U7MTH6_CORMO
MCGGSLLRAAPRTLPPSLPFRRPLSLSLSLSLSPPSLPSSLPACCLPACLPAAASLPLPAGWVLKLGGWQRTSCARDEPHQPFPGSQRQLHAAGRGLTVRNEERGDNAGRPTHTTKLESIQVIEECQNPTADEILSWAQNFDKMMKTPAGRNLFREFLRTEYSEENLLFWLACEDLKKEQNKKVIEEKARLIYEDYISILSPKEVSLDSRVREVINRNLLDPSPHMYEDAQLQIYTLMHRDSFPRSFLLKMAWEGNNGFAKIHLFHTPFTLLQSRLQ